MRRIAAGLLLSLVGGAAVVAAAACSDSDALAGKMTPGDGDASTTSDSGVPFGDAGALPLQADGVVLVHAASFPAFRICFGATPDAQPFPTQDLMPQSNLPGVDIGTAVRFDAPKGNLGTAVVYLEERIRPAYFGKAETGPTCGKLAELSLAAGSVKVHDGISDLSRGVHLMVLQGCAKQSIDPTAEVGHCGADWTPEAGNLALDTITVSPYTRMTPSGIPVQIIQLSRDLEMRAGSRAIGLGLGTLDATAPAPFLELGAPFGRAVPTPPAVADISSVDVTEFERAGLFVTLGSDLDAGDGGDAAEPREVVLSQSLADIQRRSSPRSLPPEWFATASSYVVLSVGEFAPKDMEGGPGDPRRNLHLLAVPLAVPPKPDAGAPDASNNDD